MKIAPVADVKARFKKGGGVRHEDFWKAAEKKERRRNPLGGFCGKAENVMTFFAYWQKQPA